MDDVAYVAEITLDDMLHGVLQVIEYGPPDNRRKIGKNYGVFNKDYIVDIISMRLTEEGLVDDIDKTIMSKVADVCKVYLELMDGSSEAGYLRTLYPTEYANIRVSLNSIVNNRYI